MIDQQTSLPIQGKNTIINGANKIRTIQEQNDRKQGFDVIWYYCYLKYFVGKSHIGNKQQQQQSIKKKELKQSPKKHQLQQQSIQALSLTNNNNNTSQQQEQEQQQQIKQQQPLSLSKISQTLRQLKQDYLIQTIQRHSDHTLNTIKQRALLSRNDRFFVIQPQKQIKQIEHKLRTASINLKNGLSLIQSCLQDMLLELYSYYLNSRNVYLIYKKTANNTLTFNNNITINTNNNTNKLINNTNINSAFYENNSISSSIDSTQNRLKMILTHNSSQSRLNTSKDSKASLNNQRNQRRSYGSLKSSLVKYNNNTTSNNINMGNKLLEQDSILMLGNNLATQSLVGQGDKLDNKIQQMEIIDKFAEFDGLELWNIKYKKIPHTFIKFKKQSWTKCLNLPILHPSAPKTINELPIIPRITKLNPSIDKLMPFVSLIKMLQKYFPNLLPSIDSIYQYNNMPIVFLQEDNGYGSWKWQTNIGVLCYYVVYGNDQETLSIKKVERWVEQNGESVLGRTIKEMTKRQKEKNRKRKQLLRSINISSNNDSSNSNNNNNNSNNNTTSIPTTITPIPLHSNPSIISPSLHMLITKDENSDLAIW